jgi:hypothetical protein
MSKGKKSSAVRSKSVRHRLAGLKQSDLAGAARAGCHMVGDRRPLVWVEQALTIIDQQIGCRAEEPVELTPQARLDLPHLPHALGAMRALLKVSEGDGVDLSVGCGHNR